MISRTPTPTGNARTRAADSVGVGGKRPLFLLAPALLLVLTLFGGGLFLGLLQSLGHLPLAGMKSLTFEHLTNVLGDPDFFHSLAITLYIAAVSTFMAAAASIALALALAFWAVKNRLVHFVVQIPLTVPHLVIAVSVVFMLSPAGLLSRAASSVGLIAESAAFPLMINDRWGIGIILAYVWKEIPFITLMILSALRHGGLELLDVGRTLKADAWQRFRFITLPMIFPSLGAASLIVFAYTFGAFEIPFLLGRTYPMMLPVWAYKNYSDVDLTARPEGIATGLIIAAVVSLIIVCSQAITRAARKRGAIL